MPEITTTRLPFTDYYLTIKGVRNSKWQREWENSTGDIKTLLERDCEVEKVMKFLEDTDIFLKNMNIINS